MNHFVYKCIGRERGYVPKSTIVYSLITYPKNWNLELSQSNNFIFFAYAINAWLSMKKNV